MLTSERDFGGSLADLEAVRRAVDVPLLAKDFFVDPWQVIEARTHGADAILVIMGLVEDGLAQELSLQAEDLDMDVLCEVHTEDELRRALTPRLPADRRQRAQPRHARGRAGRAAAPAARRPDGLPDGGRVGHRARRSDALAIKATGCHAALVGTALMRDPGLIQELVGL